LAAGLHLDKLAELQRSPRLASQNWGRGPTSKGKGEGREGKGRGEQAEGGERRGREKRRGKAGDCLLFISILAMCRFEYFAC